MRRFWYNKKGQQLWSLETAWHGWKDWHFGLRAVDSGNFGDTKGLLTISLFFFVLYLGFPMNICRRKEDDYTTYVWGLEFYRIEDDLVFDWNCKQDDMSWSSTDRWWRRCYINIKDTLLGTWDSEQTELSKTTETWVDSMGGKEYPCVISVVRYDQKRRKIRVFRRRFHRIELDLDVDGKGVGAPIPGKGENSWDCDDTYSSCVSFGLGSDPLPEDPIEWAKKGFTEQIEDTRQKYGGKDWKPSRAA